MTFYHDHTTRWDVNTEQMYLDAAQTKPAIEIPFEFDMGEGFMYTGRLDRAFYRSSLAWVHEHKSVAARGTWMLERRSRMDAQFTGYNLGYKSIFGEYPAGIELNALTKAAEPELFRRGITRTRVEIDSFQTMVSSLLPEISAKIAAVEAGEPTLFRRTGILNGYCVDYGRSCPFLPLCKAPQIPLSEWDLNIMYDRRNIEGA